MNNAFMRYALLAMCLTIGSTIVFGQAQQGAWTQATPMPTARKQVANATVALDDKIYVIGGVGTDGQVLDAVEVYDPVTGTWTAAAALPLPLWRTFTAALDGKIYTFGGYRSTASFPFSPTNRAFVYDLNADEWTEIAGISSARGTGVAVAVGDKIHLLGGVTNRDVAVHQVYDPATDTYELASAMRTPRSGLSATALDGKIYVMGGYRLLGGVVSQSVLEIFDTATKSWTFGANMPSARHGIEAVALNNLIYVFGGQTPASRTLVYDPLADLWSSVSPMPSGVTMAGAASVNGLIYMMGGGPTSLNPMTDGTNLNQVFDPTGE